MELERVGGVAMCYLRLQVRWQVNDSDGLKGAPADGQIGALLPKD